MKFPFSIYLSATGSRGYRYYDSFATIKDAQRVSKSIVKGTYTRKCDLPFQDPVKLAQIRTMGKVHSTVKSNQA